MAIQSPDDFFSILEKSNLLDAEQILAARQSVQGLDDATVVARQLARDGVLTRWQAAQVLAGRSSFLLGKYKLIDLLGRGGMGRVFLGRHVTMQRLAALKIVSREVGNNPAALERFLAEARAIAALDHPAIVQAYSVDCEGDRYYIVMEYVDGRDLQRVVEDDGRLDCQTAVEYVRQAADGLAHAHERNLVHCDIKPSNLLVNNQGQVKILDMGMARLGGRDDEEDKPDSNHILGSVDYLAPEQALGSENFDHRADIYSLGCTLYFLLTGHPPFPEGTLPERILKHQTQQPRPIPTERPDVPPQLVQVCRRMMAKRPEDRFQSAAEVITALAEVSAEAVESARATGVAAARTAPDAVRNDASAPERGAAGAMAPETGILDLMKHAVATTAGRLVLGGVALLTLLVVVGVSLAIVATTSSSPSRDAPGEVAMALPDEAATNEEEQEEFDLTRAFDRPKAAQDASKTQQGTEAKAPADNEEPAPPEPEQPAADQSADEEPPAKDPPPTEADDAKPDELAEPSKSDPPERPKQPEKPKPAEKPKPQNPLRELGKPIALDGGAAPGTVMSLGELHLSEGAELHIELFGGQTAIRGKREYLVEKEKSESGTLQWLIKLQSDLHGKASTIVEIARIGVARESKELQLEWLPESSGESIQELRNCILAVRAGENTAWIGFGKPEPAEPLLLSFGKSARATLILQALPERASLGIQVTTIEGNVPKLKFEPANTVTEGEWMDIRLAKSEAALVNLRLRFTAVGRRLQVDAMPVFARDGTGQWPPSPEETQRLGTQFQIERESLDAILRKMPKHPNKKGLSERRAVCDKAIGQLAELNEFYEELNEQVKIHYRVFSRAGEREVDLWTTAVEPNEGSTAGPAVLRSGRLVAAPSAPSAGQVQFVRGGP